MKLNSFMVCLAFCALCWQFELTNSRTSMLWRLNSDDDTIKAKEQLPLVRSSGVLYSNDDVFNIIISTLTDGTSWSKHSSECWTYRHCEASVVNVSVSAKDMRTNRLSSIDNKANLKQQMRNDAGNSIVEEALNCGKPVNFTFYDYLTGVAQRFSHPSVPEPEVAYFFMKNRDEKSLKNFDISALERRLKRAKREKPRSVHLYNQIGNYFRIIGDAGQAIECFRRVLAMSPTNSEVLLNLARVLYNLQYLDEAIHLTRRSLEAQPPDRSAWRQYFTLGEIFKAYGHFQESVLHLRHALELYPQHEPILKALRDVENSPSSLNFYTVLIIAALVVAVFVVIITSSNYSDPNACGNAGTNSDYEPKTQRHFNRAMAMRSLKGLSPRPCKQRRY